MTDDAKPTLLLIDGHSLAFRAFYALPVESFRAQDGQHTNAIHGFISMFLNLLAAEKPTHVVVAFDISRYSFRTREYPEYKGTRGETPPEFIGQVPLLQDALAAMNVTTLQKEDFEADDILATLSARGTAEGFRVLVVSGDRDTIQLVNDDCTLLYPSARGVAELKRYTPDAVMERYGIRPDQYPMIAALVGETSDNLPGVDKVGEKTAVKWIQQFGSLDALLENRDSITGVVGQNLRDQVDRVIRNRKLNHLLRDVELPVTLGDTAIQPVDAARVTEVFDRLQFRSLKSRVLGGSQSSGSTSSIATADAVAPGVARIEKTAPEPRHMADEELAAWLSANGHHRIAVFLDGTADEFVVGLATEDTAVRTVRKSDSLDHDALVSWLSSDAPKVVFDARSLLRFLAPTGIVIKGIVRDIRVAAWIDNTIAKSLALPDIARELTGLDVPTPDPDQLVPDTNPNDAAVTAWILTQLDEVLSDRLDVGQRGVESEIELPLIPILVAMEDAGVDIDLPVLDTLYSELTTDARAAETAAFEIIGKEMNLSSPKQLQEVLFSQLGMPTTRATKTGYSTDAAALADLQENHPHPFLDLLLKHREVTKLAQIVEVLRKSVRPDGRIHTHFDQTGTSTGRLSSLEPNLQNIPIRSEVGARIREAFRADAQHESLVTADYSQIEMRIMAHLSKDEGLIEAFRSGEDLHRFVGAQVFGVAPEDVTPEMRSKVKAMSYGLAYGLSAFGLAKQLRIDNKEAKALMGDYFARFGAVRDYLRSGVEQAHKDLFTTTVYGRKRPFGDLASSNRILRDNAERAALNAPIQGTAADIMKIAMIRTAEALRASGLKSRLLLQVHDELILEAAPGEVEQLSELVRSAMEQAVTLSVPLDVNIGIGSNWRTAGH
ncbi:MAG: DNA polymerase I [Microbacteriaceae bacterium]